MGGALLRQQPPLLSQGQWAAGGPVESFRAPLELKTGKMFRKQGSVEHRAQVRVWGEGVWSGVRVCGVG